MRWLASFTAKGNRRQIWAVGFHHECVQRNFRSDLPDAGSIFESHNAGKRNQVTKTKDFVRLFESAAEAMEHAADFRP
jgi:hypothetical protein